MPVNEMERKGKEQNLGLLRKQEKGFGSDEGISRAPSQSGGGNLRVTPRTRTARIQPYTKSALTERHQFLTKLHIGRLSPSAFLFIFFLFSLTSPLASFVHSMRPQLFRAAARSVRVPKVNTARAFATTIPRSAEVELTIGMAFTSISLPWLYV